MPTESAKTYYLARKILNHVLAVEHFQMPASVYLALYPDDPGDGADAFAELAAGGYQRTQIRFSTATNLGTIVSNAVCEFPTALEDWGEIHGWAIFDQQTGGSPLDHGAFETARTILNGDACRVNAGELTITEY